MPRKQHNIDLTPTEAMIAAVSSGLDAAKTGKGGVGLGETTRARARNIKNGKVTPALVKRMNDFFAQYTGQRPDGIVEGTAWHTAWQLHGGDAGKAWAAARIKELHAAEVDLSDDGDEHVVVFKELFFDDPRVSQTADGLIWKPVLRTGYWKVGPNGKPLMVVDGHSQDQRNAIGMQDIVDNYNAGAVEHVTVPTDHADKVDQNTGYVRALKIHRTDSGAYLMAGHDFTEPSVKGMIERGTIPNTSVGLEFDYVRKEDGKKFPVVLKHVALTHRPWINKLAPFGVAASEDSDITYEVEALEFSEEMTSEHADEFKLSAWDEALTMDEIRDSIESSLDSADELVDVAHDRVLIKSGDKKYVALFSVKDGDVEVQKRDEWAEQANLEVEDNGPPAATPPTSDPPSTVPTEHTEDNEGDQVPDFNDNDKADLAELLGDDYAEQLQAAATSPEYDAMVKKFKAKGLSDAQAAAFATQAIKRSKKTAASEPVADNPFVLSESPEFKRQQEETARLRAENDQLLADKRQRETDEFVDDLKAVGFTEEAGCTEFLKEMRSVMLADRGDAVVLLSDEDGGTAQPITATTLLRRVFGKLPSDDKTNKLVVQFSEQASDPLRQHQKPPLTDDSTNLAETDPEAFEKQQDELYSKMYGKPVAAPAPTN